MSETKSRFRIRNGEVEIEYEGPLKDVNEHYRSAFEWLASGQARKKVKREEEKKEEKDKRGGIRKTIYTQKIDELVNEDFFAERKSLDDVIKGLVPKNVPTRGRAKNAILTNLRRRIARRDTKLKGAKEEGIWYFWID